MDVFTANFVMSTLPPDDESQTERSVGPVGTKVHRKQDKSATTESPSHSKNVTLLPSDVIDLDAEEDIHIPATVATTVATTATTQSTLLNERATLATTVTSQYNDHATTLHNQQQSPCSPTRNGQSANTNAMPKRTESEETWVTFRPESDTGSRNVDDEIDCIPLSPQPERRRRFKIFPRLYEKTQYVSSSTVLQENTDDEL